MIKLYSSICSKKTLEKIYSPKIPYPIYGRSAFQCRFYRKPRTPNPTLARFQVGIQLGKVLGTSLRRMWFLITDVFAVH